MIGKMTSLAVTGPSRLDIAWDEGHSASVDLSETLKAFPALAPLSKATEFARAAISPDGWSLDWPSGIDFGSAQLRRWADEQSGDVIHADAFRNWMKTHNFTQDAAAQALGLSRRMIAYYLSGEKPIPKTVLLATEGYAARALA